MKVAGKICGASLLVLGCVGGAHALTPSASDLWDVSQGATVTGTSGVVTGACASNAGNMFGGNIGGPSCLPDVGVNAVFQDFQAAGFLHWVEWRTAAPVTLGSFNLVASHDSGFDGFNQRNINYRGFRTFRLYSGDGAGNWTLLYTYTADPDSDLDYGGGPNFPAQNLLELTASVTPTVAQYFRAEFVQYGTGSPPSAYGDAQGPRIHELDGYAPQVVPVTAQPIPTLSEWALILLSFVTASCGAMAYRRRRASGAAR
jgi:hypothetical protein